MSFKFTKEHIGMDVYTPMHDAGTVRSVNDDSVLVEANEKIYRYTLEGKRSEDDEYPVLSFRHWTRPSEQLIPLPKKGTLLTVQYTKGDMKNEHKRYVHHIDGDYAWCYPDGQNENNYDGSGLVVYYYWELPEEEV